MPKTHVSGNQDKQLSYEETETDPNIMARPGQIIVGMFWCTFPTTDLT